ncbi:MAG: hypothetical protein Q4C87_11530 [Actinomycetaceae bacterium]|nr:hypothetical protein [Actinomycetaceae bacterium]
MSAYPPAGQPGQPTYQNFQAQTPTTPPRRKSLKAPIVTTIIGLLMMIVGCALAAFSFGSAFSTFPGAMHLDTFSSRDALSAELKAETQYALFTEGDEWDHEFASSCTITSPSGKDIKQSRIANEARSINGRDWRSFTNFVASEEGTYSIDCTQISGNQEIALGQTLLTNNPIRQIGGGVLGTIGASFLATGGFFIMLFGAIFWIIRAVERRSL